MSLTKEQILAARKRVVEPVNIPEWGGTAHVRMLTTAEQIRMEDEIGALDEKDVPGITAVQLAFYLSDESGVQILTVGEAMNALKRADPPPLEAPAVARIIKSGGILNRGLSTELIEKLKGN